MCDNQDHPRLTVQNLTFIDGNSKNETEYDGGGAIWARGGQLKIVNSRFSVSYTHLRAHETVLDLVCRLLLEKKKKKNAQKKPCLLYKKKKKKKQNKL